MSDGGAPVPGGLRRHLLAMLVAGALLRGAVALAAGVDLPAGGDAQYWGVRALEIGRGDWSGTHPPVYPALAALLAGTTGIEVGT
ncbi:MAG: hypothetical protein FJ090_19885, partial [Deltaproteobacteria bacterium]|nr:hypothetical protein [Deltaproteobacteria bacterium]